MWRPSHRCHVFSATHCLLYCGRSPAEIVGSESLSEPIQLQMDLIQQQLVHCVWVGDS